MTLRLLVIENEPLAGIGGFGDWLREAGLSLRCVRAHAGEAVPEEVAEDGLVVLGGPMSADDDERAPWLPATRRLLRDAIDRQAATLGICLGAELLALAAGGQVAPGAAGPEIGSRHITIHPSEDPLFDGLSTPASFIFWHGDVITRLPRGAIDLARTSTYPCAAFRVGDRAWGVQFHPEASVDQLVGWARLTGELEPDRAEAMIRVVRASQDEIASASRKLATNFAKLVYSRRRVS